MANPVDSLAQANQEKHSAALSSVVAAVFLTTMKIIVGLLTGSLGILSEAAHSALDLVAAAVTFFAVRLSGKPADTEHTYGHGKIENISALFETLLLLLTCVWIIYEAVRRLFFEEVHVEATIWAFLVMAISIVIDYSRSRILYRAARKYGSQALEADALHFSTDIWSSSVVIGGLFLVFLSQRINLPWLAKADAVAALGVAVIVVYVSLQLGRRTINDLIDAVRPGLREEVGQAIQQVTGVLAVERVRIRRAGPEYFADVAVTVSRETALEMAHAVAHQVETATHGILPGADVVVNVTPVASDHEGVLTSVRLLAARNGLGAHGIRIYDVFGKRTLELHLEVVDSLSLEEAHNQATTFEEALRQALPDIEQVVSHIEPTGDATATRQVVQSDEVALRKALHAICNGLGVDCQPHEIVVLRTGDELAVSFHCRLDKDLPITDAHSLTERIESDLRARVAHLGRVVIHVEPGEATEDAPPTLGD